MTTMKDEIISFDEWHKRKGAEQAKENPWTQEDERRLTEKMRREREANEAFAKSHPEIIAAQQAEDEDEEDEEENQD